MTADPDWVEVVAGHVVDLVTAWSDPGAWFGADDPELNLAPETWGKIALTELVVHGSDLARASDQVLDLPRNLLQATYDHVSAFVPNAPVPTIWGDPVELGPDRPLLDRILAVTGRMP